MQPTVYILASQTRGTLYVGVTSDLMRRVHQHREGTIPGFTADHGVKRLVHIEPCPDMPSAIAREKQLKAWRRGWKIAMIEEANATWRDLAIDLGFGPLCAKRAVSVPRMDPDKITSRPSEQEYRHPELDSGSMHGVEPAPTSEPAAISRMDPESSSG